jgi:hypothetical protein
LEDYELNQTLRFILGRLEEMHEDIKVMTADLKIIIEDVRDISGILNS